VSFGLVEMCNVNRQHKGKGTLHIYLQRAKIGSMHDEEMWCKDWAGGTKGHSAELPISALVNLFDRDVFECIGSDCVLQSASAEWEKRSIRTTRCAERAA